MRCTIDKAGRLVIPQEFRRSIGLPTGGEVEIFVDAAGLRIEPVPGEGLETDGDLLVIPSTGAEVDDNLVRDMRHADQR